MPAPEALSGEPWAAGPGSGTGSSLWTQSWELWPDILASWPGATDAQLQPDSSDANKEPGLTPEGQAPTSPGRLLRSLGHLAAGQAMDSPSEEDQARQEPEAASTAFLVIVPRTSQVPAGWPGTDLERLAPAGETTSEPGLSQNDSPADLPGPPPFESDQPARLGGWPALYARQAPAAEASSPSFVGTSHPAAVVNIVQKSPPPAAIAGVNVKAAIAGRLTPQTGISGGAGRPQAILGEGRPEMQDAFGRSPGDSDAKTRLLTPGDHTFRRDEPSLPGAGKHHPASEPGGQNAISSSPRIPADSVSKDQGGTEAGSHALFQSRPDRAGEGEHALTSPAGGSGAATASQTLLNSLIAATPSGGVHALQPDHAAGAGAPRPDSRPTWEATRAPAAPDQFDAPPPAEARDISVQIRDETGKRVDLRFTETGGSVRLAIATSSEALSHAMQNELPSLERALGENGWMAELHAHPMQPERMGPMKSPAWTETGSGWLQAGSPAIGHRVTSDTGASAPSTGGGEQRARQSLTEMQEELENLSAMRRLWKENRS